ncbi:hypothetical protein RchiOBHm_Chr1g0340821 [Rosa chinensis]|uniref:Uncharacterized protein n=1 Tax=Rosa chinensis TaxID=74649 RepID=A0A2P6SDL2_ROSCH|nr:hypothetical protein RchiOBHm_Chr1g0340821 [Rosa chinensis]
MMNNKMGANESKESSGQGENGGASSSGYSWFSKAAVAAGAIAGLATAALAVAELVSGSTSLEEEKKTMKAPGRDERIYREDFERDPKSYFSGLRNK